MNRIVTEKGKDSPRGCPSEGTSPIPTKNCSGIPIPELTKNVAETF